MNDPSPQEVAHVAASIRLTGELLEAHGVRALEATKHWGAGPRSPALDPTSRGNPPNPDDGIVPDPDRDTYRRLRYLLDSVAAESHELRVILHKVAGTTVKVPEPDTPAQVSAAGWCVSCWRDEKDDGSHWCEPVAMLRDGRRRYRDYCQWCGEWQAGRAQLEQQVLDPLIDALPNNRAKKVARNRLKAADRKHPPLELVQARHRGERITQPMVVAALAKLIEPADQKAAA